MRVDGMAQVAVTATATHNNQPQGFVDVPRTDGAGMNVKKDVILCRYVTYSLKSTAQQHDNHRNNHIRPCHSAMTL
jgi:hypothetical protein